MIAYKSDQPVNNPNSNNQRLPVSPNTKSKEKKHFKRIKNPLLNSNKVKKYINKHKNYLLSVAIVSEAIILILLLPNILLNLSINGAQKVSDQFMIHLKVDEVQATVALSSKTLKSQYLSDFINPLAPLLSDTGKVYKTGKLKHVNHSADAVVIYKASTTEKHDVYIRFVLTKEDKEWKVLNLKNSNSPLRVN